MIVLLTLGEGSQLVNAVTEETTSSTTAKEEVLPAQGTVDSSEKTVTSSSEVAEEETTSSSEEATTESTTETSEETEKKKEKSKATRASSDPVTFNDPELEKWIRGTLNYPYGINLGLADTDPVTEEHMEKITELKRGLNGSGHEPLSDLSGLEYASNLEKIDFIADVLYPVVQDEDKFTALPTEFKKLTKLKSLNFHRGVLNNIDALKDHPSLEVFLAVENELTSLEGLSGCKELTKININGSANSSYHQNGGIQNFKGLEECTKLKEIYFRKYNEDQGPTLTNIGTAESSYVGYGLQSLEGLNCAGSLETLDLEGHPGLHTLDGLQGYTKMTTLKIIGAYSYNGRRREYDNPGTNEIDFDPAVHTPMYNKRGLRGANALDALANCSSLETVDLNGHAIEDISPLANKPSIKTLDLKLNLLETIQPLLTTNKLVKLNVSHNLLTNLSGLKNTDTLEELDCSMQNAGADQIQINYGAKHYLRGLLDDVTDINSTSLKIFYCYNNRLDNLDSLKNASNLEKLSAYNNKLSDIKGDLDGCVSLDTVSLNNNKFVNFKDTGLGDSKDSLKYLYLNDQGLDYRTSDIGGNDYAILEGLDGLQEFTILEHLNLNTNIIADSEMKYIPVCIKYLYIRDNELASKAFETFDHNKFTRLESIDARYNHISDIRPLEAFTNPISVDISFQDITVPKHGGKIEKKADPNVGLEVDILKSDKGTGLSYTKVTGAGAATFDVKAGTSILDVTDSNYDLEGKRVVPTFEYSDTDANFSSFKFGGVIRFDVDYEISTEAQVDLVPTDINGDEITEIPQGGIIYWRAKVKSKDARYLMKPDFKHHLQYSPHALLDPYVEPVDAKASEYVQGARVEIDKTYVPTPSGIWSQVDALHNMINSSKVADITVVTKVNDNASPGDTANLYFNVAGKNFKLVGATKTVLIKASTPEVLTLSAPKRFDFGKGNEASKSAKTYCLSTKGHTADEQSKGFKVRVTDTMQTSKRVDWEVVAKLSDLNNSKGTALKNASASPKLSLSDITLAKITDPGGAETETPIAHGSPNNPTWEQSIELTAGGPSVTLSEAAKADGSGTWDYKIPFDKVKLEVPSNVNDQAGYTFNGKVTWTLDDTL